MSDGLPFNAFTEVVAEVLRAGHGEQRSPSQFRLPFVLPCNYVPRQDLLSRLVNELRHAKRGQTIFVYGAGGSGKTTLVKAAWNAVADKFTDGVLWRTVGERRTDSVSPEDFDHLLADLFVQLVEQVTGKRPAFSGPSYVAALKLGSEVAGRDYLLVADDLWTQKAIEEFQQAAVACVLVITTQCRNLVIPDSIHVGEMNPDEAEELLLKKLPTRPDRVVDLLAVAGTFPLPLHVESLNGAIRSRLRCGLSIEEAVNWVLSPSQSRGRRWPLHGNKKLRDGLAMSLEAFEKEHGRGAAERFRDLAIFPEDTKIPVDVLKLWWSNAHNLDQSDVDMLCGWFGDQSLLAEQHGNDLLLHDMWREALRCDLETSGLVERQRSVIDAFRAATRSAACTGWSSLPYDSEANRYVWAHLVTHLIEARLNNELKATLSDLRWVTRKIELFGSTAALVDLQRAADLEPLAAMLLSAISRAGHLFEGFERYDDLAATILAQLHESETYQEAVARFEATLTRPFFRRSQSWTAPSIDEPGHAGPVRGVDFHPVGKLLVSGGLEDATIRIWDADSFEQLTVLKGHRGGIRALAFDPAGRYLASAGGDGTIRVWEWGEADTAQPRLHRLMSAGRQVIRSVAWAPNAGDPRLVSGGEDCVVHLWNGLTGAEMQATPLQNGWVRCVVFIDTNTVAFCTNSGSVEVWSLTTGEIRTIGDHKGCWVRSVASHPDGTQVAAMGENGNVYLWVAEPHSYAPTKPYGRSKAHSDFSRLSELPFTRCINYDPTGTRIVTASVDGTAAISDVSAMKVQGQPLMGRHRGLVASARFDPRGQRIVTAGEDGRVCLWRADESGECLAVLERKVPWARSVAVSESGDRIACGSGDGSLTIFERHLCNPYTITKVHNGAVNTVAFDLSARWLVSGGEDGMVILHSIDDRSTIMVHRHELPVRCTRFGTGIDRIVSGGDDRAVVLHVREGYDFVSRVLGHHDRQVLTATFGPADDQVLSCGADRTLRLWAFNGESRVMEHDDWVWTAIWDEDGRTVLSAAGDSAIRRWNVTDLTELKDDRIPPAHTDWIRALAIYKAGRLVSGGQDGTLRLWDRATKQCLTLIRIDSCLLDVAFAPAKSLAVVATTSGLALVEIVDS